jgi:hypothetical protein
MDFFSENISRYQKDDKRLSKLFNQISTIRIITFIVALILAVYAADIPSATGLAFVIIIFLISFVILVKWHNRIKYVRNHARFLVRINEDELKRVDGRLAGFKSGEEFKSDTHHYSNDLDVFGRNSIFQLLNRCTTLTGREILADWLLEPSDKITILKRQKAVEELKTTPDFCQNFEAVGLHLENEKANFEPLMNWLKEPAIVRTNKLLVFASYALPSVTIILLIGIIWFNVPIAFILLVLLVAGILLKTVLQYSLIITEQTNNGVSTLATIAQLIKEVEKKEFSSDLLKEIKERLFKENISASKRIDQLARILDFLNSRGNMLYLNINFLFLLDIHLISRAEKWKLQNEQNVKKWVDGISEFEAISSLARFAHANPNFIQPSIEQEDYQFKTTNMSHPLIKPHERIGNDFKAGNKGEVMIITGSNMSGKSTFLRTIGVNVVLALAGAHVSADKMSLSKMLIFTSMRTQDNLEEHISSFYAELKRIEQLLALVKDSETPVLFMLDEILKGTNSHDRHKGGVAIVKQLHNTNSFGFVSTHDIELGEQAKEFGYCANYSFNSNIVKDKILFDYKIANGVCQSFNASALMKNIGIEIE